MRIDCCISYFQKQLIGLLPNGQECLFYYAPDINVNKWSIDGNGVDNPSAVNSSLNPYGIYYNYFSSNIVGEYRFVISFVGVEPPTYLPVILDDSGNPVIYTLTNCCTKVCLEGTFNSNDYLFFQTGYGWISDNNIIGTFADSTTWENLLKSLYGQQTTYSYIDNGDGTTFITIDNAYICSPIAWSADDVTYQDMVACGYVPPITECYYYNFTELGGNQFTDLFLDSALTIPAFNDIYGNGNLRNQLNALGGDLYWFFNGGFVLQGLWSHYYGTAPISIDLYDINGDILFTLSFNENSLNGFSCDSKNNYTMTFDKGYDRFYGLAFEGINNFDYVYPTSTPYITDINDLVLMQNLINWIYGNNATYSLIDNGATYTMEIKNAIYWGAYPRWNLYNGVTIDAITMTPF